MGYLFPYSFISLIFFPALHPSALTHAHCYFEPLYVCVRCQAAAGFVYSAWASCLHTTRTALIWNDQNHINRKKKRVKPRLPRCSLTQPGVLYIVWRQASNNQTYSLCLTEEKRHIKINLFSSGKICWSTTSLVIFVICDKQHGRVLSFHRKWFSRTLPGHQSNCLKVFLVSKICHHYDIKQCRLNKTKQPWCDVRVQNYRLNLIYLNFTGSLIQITSIVSFFSDFQSFFLW